jgi:hypothetical protein
MQCYSSALSIPETLPVAFYDYDAAPDIGSNICDEIAVYHPRNPEDNPLYGIISGHLETFLASQRERDRPVPPFVERELRGFLDCGVLANGFLRVH